MPDRLDRIVGVLCAGMMLTVFAVGFASLDQTHIRGKEAGIVARYCRAGSASRVAGFAPTNASPSATTGWRCLVRRKAE